MLNNNFLKKSAFIKYRVFQITVARTFSNLENGHKLYLHITIIIVLEAHFLTPMGRKEWRTSLESRTDLLLYQSFI